MKSDLLPFPTGSVESPPQRPINNHLLSRASSFAKELPELLNDGTLLVREYFLTEVFPLFVALQTGMDDANDVIKLTLDEEPESAGFEHMLKEAVVEALAIKMATFVTQYTKLDKEQSLMFLMVFISKTLKGADHGHVAEALLRKMQQVLDLQGPSENNPTPRVRKVPAAAGNTRRKRTDGAKPDNPARGGRGPSRKTAQKKK